jgi:signal transduction histidine kinase
MNPPTEWPRAAAAAALIGVLCTVTAAVTVDGNPSDHAWLEATARMLMLAVPIAVGLYARRDPVTERFGTLLAAAGAGWFLTTLSDSPDELFYSLGRVSGWIIEPALVYMVLAFPTGRVAGVDRMLVIAAVLVAAILYVPTALLVEAYPTPFPYGACDSDCPGNAFMLVGSEPAFVGDIVRPLREVLTVVLFAAATVRVAARVASASPLMRRTLVAVLAVAAFRLTALATGFVVRALAPESRLVDLVMLSIGLALPALACAFLFGVVRWRLFMAGAMERLATRGRAHAGPGDLRAALAEAFEDPELEVAYWAEDDENDGRWVDAGGGPAKLASAGPKRSVTEIHDGDRRIAAIVHDPALKGDRAFIESASSYAVMTLENHRLSGQAAALLNEVFESRARIQTAADEERRRIEHDLHDGAQQRLVTLRIKLELAAEQYAADDRNAELLRRLGAEIEEALDEVRSLARGIYPAPLAARGLVEALRAAALRSALPTTVLAAGVGRYPREIETAAYFCCLEAMQNAAKHAAGATATVVDLSYNGSLRLEIRDDGVGFEVARVNGGVGLMSMRDRLAAVGGRIAIVTSPGQGTRVVVTIPLEKQTVGLPEPSRTDA